jgi:peptide/nickel transport system permease protein
MINYAIRRLCLSVPTLLIVTMIVFLSLRYIPGDVVDLMAAQWPIEPGMDLEQIKKDIRAELGLDKPILKKYGIWLCGVVHGDIGDSL